MELVEYNECDKVTFPKSLIFISKHPGNMRPNVITKQNWIYTINSAGCIMINWAYISFSY